MCDSPSSPEYKQKMPMERPQVAVVLASWPARPVTGWQLYDHILHHAQVACHGTVLRTMCTHRSFLPQSRRNDHFGMA
jgi:hypothetical protein